MIDIDFKYYRAIFLKGLPLILLIWMPIAALAVYIAYKLPAIYQAEARILVETSQIPGTLAQSTVTKSSTEIIEQIRQRLLTRNNFLEIAEEFNVFPDEDGYSPSQKVESMRAATGFDVQIFAPSPRTQGATTFTISFESPSPILAAQITNEMVTRILEQNSEIRKGAVEETVAFFRQEHIRLGNELTDLEAQIVSFKNANPDSLPESLAFRRGEMSRLQERIRSLDTQEVTLREQRAQIVRVIENPALASTVAQVALSPEEQRLSTLKIQRASLIGTLSDQHPQIKKIDAEMAALQQIIKENNALAASGVDTGGAPSQMQLNLEQIDAQLLFIDRQRRDLEAELARLAKTIEATPDVGMSLSVLNRRLAQVQNDYDNNLNALNAATTGETIELREKGERFEVIEQPATPEQPIRPNRFMVAGGGVFGGLALGLGLVVLLELLNTSIRRPTELVNKLGIQPFATIPYIATRGEMLRSRLKAAALLMLVLAGLPALFYLIHYYYMPIDLIIAKVMDRFGLTDLTRALS